MESEARYTILAVDDERANLLVLNRILSVDYTILTAKSGAEALARAINDKPDLIILDIVMPDMSGFEVLAELKARPETGNIPVIVVTSLDGGTDEEQGFRLGAVDYITKPFKNAVVRARIKNHIQILRQLRLTEKLGFMDSLTEIANRRCFDEHIAMEWRRALRERIPLSFLMMDVDWFKRYNDTYGHPQGDELLRAISRVFENAARRSTDLAARLGGEEFGLLLPNTDADAALGIAEKIRADVERLRVPLIPTGEPTAVTISIGCNTGVPADIDALRRFIALADERLYHAKNAGRNRVCAGEDDS